MAVKNRINMEQPPAHHLAIFCLNELEKLRDCGHLPHDLHGEVTQMAERMQEIWSELKEAQA